MSKVLMTLLLLGVLLVGPAFADDDHSQNNDNSGTITSTSTITSTATDSNNNITNTTNTTTGLSDASAAALLGAKPASNESTTVNSHNRVETPRQAPAVHAPNLVASPETCSGSTSGGLSTPFGGLSLGTTWQDKDCTRRMYARTLIQMGLNEAAMRVIANNPEVKQALIDSKVLPAVVPAAAPPSPSLGGVTPTTGTPPYNEVSAP